MSRTRKFVGGVSAGYASQAVLTLVGLWLTRFLLERLGQEEYGLWLVATQVLAYLMLMDLGIVALLPREIAYATGREKAPAHPTQSDLSGIVGETWRIVAWQMPLVAGVAAAFWLFLPADWELLRNPLGVVMLAFVVTFPLRVPPGALRGLQDLAFLSATHTAAWLAGTAATVTLVLAGFGLYALAIGWIVTQVIAGTVAWARLARRYPHAVPARLPRLRREALRTRFGRGAWVSVSQIAQALLSGTDVIIIGKLLGAAAVVPYMVTGKLISVLAHQPQILMHAAEPGLSELRTGESRERILQASNALTQGVLIFSGAIVCGVLVVNHAFVRLWVGEEHWGGFTLSALILARTLLFHWNLTIGAAIFAFGYERRLAIVALLDGATAIGISIFLVPRLGPAGAVVGSIVGVSLVSLPANLAALARETGVGLVGLIGAQWAWAWRFSIVLAAAAFAALSFPPAALMAIAGSATGVGIVYAALMVRRVLEPPIGLYLHPTVAAWLRKLPGAVRRASPT